MTTMTADEAYAAMLFFLDQFWKRTRSDDLGGLLGSMFRLQDGTPADQAIGNEWAAAVSYAVAGSTAGSLELK